MSEPDNTVTFKTETMVAQDLRTELQVALDGVVAIMNRAQAAGMAVQFGFSKDGFGRSRWENLAIMKLL